MASLIGKEIGKYRITERIGHGGMAEVYLGTHIYLDRPVAIKVLHGFLLENEALIERFKREAKAVANLHHPNIVQVYDFEIQDDIIFMVMEYIAGKSLQEVLTRLSERGIRYPIKQIGSIINDVAGALDYAHTQGMLHRDVKPSNILIDQDGKAYLTDFGIARILSDHKLTATGTIMGTPAYMSPEQGRGDELTEESDIYSLGIVAFEMLTGQVPYDAKTPVAVVLKQITEPVPDISKIVDDVPLTAQEVVEKALAKSPEVRYSSAEELVRALKIALEALESTEGISTPTVEIKLEEVAPPDATVGLTGETASLGSSQATVEMKEDTAMHDEDQPTVMMEEAFITAEEDQPTVAMAGVPGPIEDDHPTVLMAENEQQDREAVEPLGSEPGLDGAPEEGEGDLISTAEEAGSEQDTQTQRRKIPVWAVVAAVIGLIAVITVVVIQFIDFRKPLFTLVFDAANQDAGLSLVTGGFMDVEAVVEDGEVYWRSGSGEVLPSGDANNAADNNLYFDIDDNQVYKLPLGTEVHILIYFLDLGYDNFNIEYDAHTGDSEFVYKATQAIQKTGSKNLRVAEYVLNDAYFSNRLGNADFCIVDGNNGPETISKVEVAVYPP